MSAALVAGRFEPGSLQHVVLVLLTALGALTIVRWGRRRRGTRRERSARRCFAAVSLLVTLTMQAYVLLPGVRTMRGSWPLQLSDLADYSAAFALWTSGRRTSAFTYYVGLSLTLMAVITPALTQPFPDPRWFGFWLRHIAVVWAAAYLVFGLGVRPTWRLYRTTTMVVLVWAAIAYVFDRVTGTNYGYLVDTPSSASLLDLLGPWPWYVVSAMAVLLGVWALAFTLPWELARARPADGATATVRGPSEHEAPPTSPAGLTAQEVAERVRTGRTNRSEAGTSRPLGQILRANVITPFNGLLTTLFIVIAITGFWQNALFGVVVLANTAIGVVQEVRAKRTLDRLAILSTPRSVVIRDGAHHEVAVEDVVEDDLVLLQAGDQVTADGQVSEATGLEIDESLLTGESDPVAKRCGDTVLSGSIVVAGRGTYRATRVGRRAYAAGLAAAARRYTVTRSELVGSTNDILRWISVMMLVVGPVVLWSQFRSADSETWQDAVTGAGAALVGMVPEGLVLLTSLAFMLGGLALARRQTLVQELPAVEALARVDVVCLDKTGTLTDGESVLDRVLVLDPGAQDDVEQALAALAVSGENATARAIATAMPAPTWRPSTAVPFSSARSWSAIMDQHHGSWLLGAPEVLAGGLESTADPRTAAPDLAGQGLRVLLLAASPQAPVTVDGTAVLPPQRRAVALVALAERIRQDAAETLSYFAAQDVALKIISGDSARTVGAVAARVGVPGVRGPADAVDARTLPEDPAQLAEALARHSVFGRVTPHQKRAMVRALQSQGHTVAMTGDGVNDALALKDADLGVAMGNGAPATRAVAQLVLLDGCFAHLPEVVAEGRRVIANIERAASLFLAKNVYSVLLALISASTLTAYPLAPVQLSLISTVTIGVPGFFLALGPNPRRYVPGFLHRVLRFSVPVGMVIGACAYAGYLLAREVGDAGVAGGRSTATVVVLVTGLWVVLVQARPLAGWKLALVAGLAATVAAVVVTPALHGLFLLDLTPWRLSVASALGVLGALLVEAVHRSVPLLFSVRSGGGSG